MGRDLHRASQVSAFDPRKALEVVERLAGQMNHLDWERPEQLELLVRGIEQAGSDLLGLPVRVYFLSDGELSVVGGDLREPLRETREAAASGGARQSGGVTALPLLVASETVGVLQAEGGPPGNDAHQFLKILASKAALAVDRARRTRAFRRDLERKEDELTRLRRCGLLISSRLRLEETLQSILQMALEVTGARYGIFRLVEGPMLVTRAIAGEGLGRPLVDALPIDPSGSVSGWVASRRQAVCIADIREEPWRALYYPLDQVLEMRSEVAVPLVGAGGRLEGVLNLESPVVGRFSEQDRLLLQGLATHAVIAIQQVRLLDALQEVAGQLLSWPCGRVLERLVELAAELLNPDDVAIWGASDPEGLGFLAGTHGAPRLGNLSVQGTRLGAVFRERLPITLSDLSDFEWRREASERGWRRAVLVPVLAGAGGDALGVFCLFSSREGPGEHDQEEWDAKVLSCLAHYAGLALENAARSKELAAIQEQRAVAESFAAIGDLAANLLHQLNNKVGIIPVRVQGIEAKCAHVLGEEPYLARNLQEIQRSAQEAMEVVRNHLGLLKPVQSVPLSVSESVTAAREVLGLPEAIVLVLRDLDRLPPVVAWERSLTLIFLNLLENAARAMQGRGTITVTGRHRGKWIEVSVADTGCGIPAELHERIFELAFSRQDYKLGFGLWWVKTLMARLGGTISVESDGRDGATFRLRFPEAGA
ncbi:MAG: GAF domain-containing sensor histidine kinase [Armatimonadetes bacterium]|nr:GAF domain-containing sensor histidine kinase [Armatimonadota bacterium]